MINYKNNACFQHTSQSTMLHFYEVNSATTKVSLKDIENSIPKPVKCGAVP